MISMSGMGMAKNTKKTRQGLSCTGGKYTILWGKMTADPEKMIGVITSAGKFKDNYEYFVVSEDRVLTMDNHISVDDQIPNIMWNIKCSQRWLLWKLCVKDSLE